MRKQETFLSKLVSSTTKARIILVLQKCIYKAGEAAFALKDNEKAADLFMKSSEISFSKAFDRYGVSALEYARDCFTALGNQEKVEELTKKIKEVNQKLNESSGSDEDQSFSVFS